MTVNKQLKDIPVRMIDRNPENPRLFFRQEEMDELTESIRKFGVQVPISVYKEGNRYVLLDGERRWRCCIKLNKATIPAIVQERPDTLTNLVLMFNIHALREQWDLLTIAVKLPRIISLYKKKFSTLPNERQLSEETGLTRSMLRRCKIIMNLPEHHIDIIKSELKKPKSEQRITEDFYIEMERSLTSVSRAMPDLIKDDLDKEKIRVVLIDKYKNDVINNIVDFRKIAKIARADVVNADKDKAEKELRKLFEKNSYSIQNAFEASVSEAYSERNIKTYIQSLLVNLDELDELDDTLRTLLKDLIEKIDSLMRGDS